jgi:CheY-like chemotaxis protein
MQVQCAHSAKEALGTLARERFDALVIDYSLPEISGIELLKILRAKGDTTPVIIFTGVGREHAAIEALNNGADFFLKKGESEGSELRELVHMINQAAERRIVGGGLGLSEKILGTAANFFQEPAYAIDRGARVIAWNRGMEEITGVAAKDILGKGNGSHALPFFGSTHPMLADLIFENDAALERHNYHLISRDDGVICAWISAGTTGEAARVLWMKAMALYDTKGAFIAALGTVRNITDDIGQDLLRQSRQEKVRDAGTPDPASGKGQVLGKLMGRAKTAHREGLRLSYREGRFADAIPHFDKAIEVDPLFAAAWHDRGVCLRELGQDREALKSFTKAAELAPDDEEFLYSAAEMLRRYGILRDQRSSIEAAVKIFSHLVEINPDHAEAWNSLGICMKDLGKEAAARQYFERSSGVIRQNRAKKRVRNLDTLV